jgi:hypothetical protein
MQNQIIAQSLIRRGSYVEVFDLDNKARKDGTKGQQLEFSFEEEEIDSLRRTQCKMTQVKYR